MCVVTNRETYMQETTTTVQTTAEQLILVNPEDEPVGSASKQAAHRGDGLLHRAFSVYLFDDNARLLLQRRSLAKPLWPGFWSNSCCSHPRTGETTLAAAKRRLGEELGLPQDTPVRFLFKFLYHARFADLGAEHEVCSVYVGSVQVPGAINPDEVAEYRFVEPDVLDRALADEPQHYTPWLRLAWTTLRREHWPTIESFAV